MHRSAYFQRLLILGLSGPLLALNLWILGVVFHYFQHLITVLVISAILAFLLNYPVRIIERFYRSRSQAVIVVLLFTLTLLVILGITAKRREAPKLLAWGGTPSAFRQSSTTAALVVNS